MSFRATGLLALVTAALAAFVWFGEPGGSGGESSAERLLPDLTPERIDSLSFEAPGRDAVRVMRKGEGWQLVEPLEAPADPLALDRIARSLSELESRGRIEEPGAREIYGLDPPRNRVGWSASGEASELALGRVTPVGGNVYASVATSGEAPPVHMVEATAALAFDVAADDLRDRRLLAFEPGEVTRLRVAARDPGAPGAGFEATLERSDTDGWAIVVPAPLPADVRAIDRLVSDLSLLRAEGFVDAPGDADRRAIEAPAFVAVVETATGAQRLDLAPVPGDAPHLRLARGRDGRFFQLRSALVEHLPSRLFDLRDRELARFDPAAAAAIEVDFADGASLTSEPHSEIVRALAELDAVGVAAEALGPDERAALGLAPARMRVRVLDEGAGELADLRLGRLDGARGVVAQVGGQETIWLVDPAIDKLLPSDASGWSALAEPEAAPQPAEGD